MRLNFKLIILAIFMLVVSTALAQPAPADQYADFQDIRLYYQNYNAGPEAVVLIHGWSCDHSFWRLQAPELAKKWRVIAVDLPGHGQSGKPDIEYTQNLFADSVAAIMQQAGVAKAVIVCHSMGYGVARAFCRMHPGKVKGLVILDGAFNAPPKNDAGIKRLEQKAGALVEILSAEDYTTAMTGFMEPMHDASTSKEIRREVIEKMLATPPHVARNSMKHCFDPDNWRELRLDAPALAIYAYKSSASPGLCPPNLEQQLRSVHPVLELVIWRDAGHFFMLERPAELNAALDEFITDVGLKKAK